MDYYALGDIQYVVSHYGVPGRIRMVSAVSITGIQTY